MRSKRNEQKRKSIDTRIQPRQDFSSLFANPIRRPAKPTRSSNQAVSAGAARRGRGISAMTLAAAITLLLAACSGSDDAGSAGPTSTLGIAPTQVVTPAANGTPVPPTPRSPADADRDLAGLPFSTADLRQAVETAGYSFSGVETRKPLCPHTSVPELPFWSANLAGGDAGPILVVWVYPSLEALAAEWEAEAGAPPKPLLEGCDLPTGFVYWNQNLVLVFETWSSLGVESPVDIEGRLPSEHPAIIAFLSMTP